MKINPLVSIAMATYNGDKFLVQQLESIVNQSHSNIELIITDDASTDQTISIVKSYQAKYSFIKLFLHDRNQGIIATFEHSFSLCTGDFIAVSDQDDIWELNKLEFLLKEMNNEDVIYSNSALIDQNGKSLFKQTAQLANLKSFYSGAPFLIGICLPGHSMLLNAKFAKSIIPFPRVIMYDRWISFCAGSNNGIKYVNKPLVKYRLHESNAYGLKVPKIRKVRKTKTEQYEIKLSELKACETAVIKSNETRRILKEMLQFFNRKLSLRRSLFFFRNINRILIIKKKNYLMKVLFCFKMFFKANY